MLHCSYREYVLFIWKLYNETYRYTYVVVNLARFVREIFVEVKCIYFKFGL